MAHPQPYNVSFRFRSLPPYRLDNVMAFNADHAAKRARSELLVRYGYSEEDLKRCLVSTSRAKSPDEVA